MATNNESQGGDDLENPQKTKEEEEQAVTREAERERITMVLDDIESELKSIANGLEQSIMKAKITHENMERKEQQLKEMLNSINQIKINPDMIPHELKISLADL